MSTTKHNTQYSIYLHSLEWQSKREERLKLDGYRCVHCGQEDKLEVHHLTYERLGQELAEDLETVCRDCHEGTHDIDPRDGKASFHRSQKQYRGIFREANLPAPWPCYFADLTGCQYGGMVYDIPGLKASSFIVHHIDGSGSTSSPNNVPANLASGHKGCHTRYHNLQRWADPVERARMSARTEAGRAVISTQATEMNDLRWANPAERKRLGARTRKRLANNPDEVEKLRIRMTAQRAEDPLIRCFYCPKHCKGWWNLLQHERVCRNHVDRGPFDRAEFTRSESLRRWADPEYKARLTEIRRARPQAEPLLCPYCGQTIRGASPLANLNQHIRAKHLEAMKWLLVE